MGREALVPLDDGLWVVDGRLKKLGIELGHRMTVIRGARGLVVHSPVECTDGLAAALAELGPVRAVLAPSLFHDLHFPGWIERYPDAAFLCAPGFRSAKPRLASAFRGEMSAPALAELDAGLEVALIDGMPRVNECVVLHRPTRTLIVADLIFNFGREFGAWGKLFLKLNGAYGKPSCSRLFRSMIREKAPFRASVQRVLELDFDRVVMGHGAVIETGGKAALDRIVAEFGGGAR